MSMVPRVRSLLLAAGLVLWCTACQGDTASLQTGHDMNDDGAGSGDEILPDDPIWRDYLAAWRTLTREARAAPAQPLATSADPDTLLTASLQAAGQPGGAASLLTQLNSAGFLNALDPDLAAYGSFAQQRLAAVVAALVNDNVAQHDAVLALADDPVFAADAYRQQLLVRAAAAMPGPEPVALWRRFAAPDNPLLYDVVTAAAASGTPAATGFLRAMLTDPAYDTAVRADWVREIVVWHRDETAIIELATHLLEDEDVPALVRETMAEAMFYPDPSRWDPAGAERAPPAVPDDARLVALKALARRARSLGSLSPEATAAADELLAR